MSEKESSGNKNSGTKEKSNGGDFSEHRSVSDTVKPPKPPPKKEK